jgi:isoprenylcysteine carboxyl methyltransferase (ICMT) family protein YpbQ
LRRDIRRLPIFGLGCAGGVTGLARTADLAKADPGSNVLFLVVELCALTFRRNDLDKSNLVATALFGDGAAGAIVSCKGEGPRLTASGEYTWPASLDIMGWDVEDDGLKARFLRSIPTLVQDDMASIVTTFLTKHDLRLHDIDAFACHPGGAKVLDALEGAFGLQAGALVESREVLRDYGNMSAATALFVLARMNWRERGRRTLLSALGAGFLGHPAHARGRMSPAVIVIALVALERLAELFYSARNTRALLARGAVEVGRAHYPLLVILHATWLASLVVFLPNPTTLHWGWLGLFAVLQVFRLWILASLGPYWTTRILTLPGAPLVQSGPYRFVRHPNYLIVVGEIASLPLAFGEVTIAIAFSILNAAVLALRISVEERALANRRGEAGPQPNV